jgi:hypothetical protein
VNGGGQEPLAAHLAPILEELQRSGSSGVAQAVLEGMAPSAPPAAATAAREELTDLEL